MKRITLFLLLIGGQVFAYDPSPELCPISDKSAVADRDFMLDLKPYLSRQALEPVTFSFVELNGIDTGLYVDNVNKKIAGRPKLTGDYHLQLSAKSPYGSPSVASLIIHVAANKQKTPVLEQQEVVGGLLAGKPYHYPLARFLTNPSRDQQVRYRIDSNKPNPTWLHIVDNRELSGTPTAEDAGKSESVTLIATSNAGGDSNPLTVNFTVDYNPDKKPTIQPVELDVKAGEEMKADLKSHIWVQGGISDDPSLKLRLRETIPEAPWLSIDENRPTELTGNIPYEAIGQDYLLSLVAETQEGGSSDMKIITMKVKIDPDKTPEFERHKPKFPPMIPGQPYRYDFTKNNGDDVIPAYKDEPYSIRFAEGYDHPLWLRLENNQLIADEVPLNESGMKELWLIIHNQPGGDSHVINENVLVVGFLNSSQMNSNQ